MDQRVFYAVTEAVQGLGYSTMKQEQLQVDGPLTGITGICIGMRPDPFPSLLCKGLAAEEAC